MPTNKRPRHYADEIMQLPPPERPTAIAGVPSHFRKIVETHVNIAESFENSKIENVAQKIARTPNREVRQKMIAKTDAVIRDRVRDRAIEIFNQLKEAKCKQP